MEILIYNQYDSITDDSITDTHPPQAISEKAFNYNPLRKELTVEAAEWPRQSIGQTGTIMVFWLWETVVG